MLVNEIIRALMKEIAVPVIDLPQYAFDKGISLESVICNISNPFKDFGYCYSGFRSLPPFLMGVIGGMKQRKILIVRDPRDMVVSLYYSMKYSHKLDEIGTPSFKLTMRMRRSDTAQSIDDYCLFNSSIYNARLYDYFEVLHDPETRVLRYEDFIYDKMALVSSICDWFSIDLSLERKQAIAAHFDYVPAQELPLEHVRQVHPGDHGRKLQPQTIDALNAVFARFLATFGYSV